MTKVEALERQIQELSSEDLAAFRKWYAEFDARMWDSEIESDVRVGRLDTMAQQAIHDHAKGKTTRL